MKKTLGSLCLFLITTIAFGQSKTKAWVVSDHHLASEVGIGILKAGGNAIDASVATAFVLAVTHPQAGNIGGGGFMVLHTNKGITSTIDFREKAPLSATPDMFLNSKGKLVKGTNHTGLKSVGVPGTVAGLYLAHQKYGSLPWEQLVQPAIDIAKNGFPISEALYNWAIKISDWSDDKALAKSFFKNAAGKLLQVGELWQQKELAQSLTYIRDDGRDGFYSGAIAVELERYMKNNGGLITLEDLRKYQAVERMPLHSTFREFDVYGMSPPSSGGVAVLQMLQMVAQWNEKPLAPGSVDQIHFIAELMRRAFADRAEHLGDPDFNVDMPISRLISKEHAQKRLRNLDMKKVSPNIPNKYGQLYDGDHTTHLSVIDKSGNAVSLTYTLEQSFGSGMGSSKLGFLLNNEMGDFNPQPGVTNTKGQVGSAANTIAPEKRMLSSMSPTIVLRDNKPYLIIGSPGGRTIINTVFQTILNVLEYDMDIEEAIEFPKIHHQWYPNVLVYEKDRFSSQQLKLLKSKGHQLKSRAVLGRLMGIKYQKNDYTGFSDSSSPDGAALFY
jgi:gamma-glutamyltranspeptidase/glutathione hydrolase